MPKIVAPLALQQSPSGYAIVVTVINNDEDTAEMVGWLTWPATEDGRFSRDRIYDALPRTVKDLRRPLIASVDRVGPGTLDVEEVRYIPADVAEAILGCPLPTALANMRVRGVPEALPLSNFETTIEQGPGEDPHGPAHQFHRTGFGDVDLQGAIGEVVSHLAEVFTARRETWTDTVVATGFVEVEHDGHIDTHPKMTAMMGNHAGAWPVDWNFGSEELAALLDRVTRLREASGGEWDVLAIRLSRAGAKAEPVDTQVRGFPVPDVVAFLEDDDAMLSMLGGAFPYHQS